MADGVGLPKFNKSKGLRWLTLEIRSVEFQGFFATLANPLFAIRDARGIV